MSQTRIEQLINEIYDFIEECKTSPLQPSKIVVSKDQLLDLVDELKRRTPDEIKRYQKIIANRDTIIAQAEEQARVIESEARERAQQLVNETEIMQSAYRQANEMIQKATAEADALKKQSEDAAESLRSGVLNYSNDILTMVQNVIDDSLKETRANSERLIASLDGHLNTIIENRRQVMEQLENGSLEDDEEYSEDDFDDIPEEAFLNNIEE